jgi:hypothetical protein
MATIIASPRWHAVPPKFPRKARRSSVSLPALIRLFGRQHSAQVHNLSSGGAMIESAVSVQIGHHVYLSCGMIDTSATVVWTSPGRFGIKFVTPVGEDIILKQLYRSDAIVTRQILRKAESAN